VILQLDAGKMHRDGHRFLLSANGVWLTDSVPPRYLLPVRSNNALGMIIFCRYWAA
jgi:RNA:NAD 2'-phosphotransferase (TPT1/KptA family)